MIELVPLTPETAPELERELRASGQPGLALPLDGQAWAAATPPGLAFVGRAWGRVIGAGGVLPQVAPRAVAWLIVEPLLPERAWVQVRAGCRTVLARAHAMGYRRIEAHVHERFVRGCRFAERLGFVLEAYCPVWMPDGAAVFSFARFEPPAEVLP